MRKPKIFLFVLFKAQFLLFVAMIVLDTDTKGQTQLHDQRQNKLFKVLPDVVLGSTACTCLTIAFVKAIEAELEALPKNAIKKNAVAEIVASLMPSFTKTHNGTVVVRVGFADDMGVPYKFYNAGKPGPVKFTVAYLSMSRN